MRGSIVRRCLVALLLAISANASAASFPGSDSPPRIASVDWTLAEILIALGVPPIALVQTQAYTDWVKQPALPPETVDIGLRAQPNRELLARLDPDLILLSPISSILVETLSRIAPVEVLSVYQPGGDLWERIKQTTRRLGVLTGREERAQQLIAEREATLTQLHERLGDAQPPLLVVQFIDDRHVRVFGRNSLFDAVLQRLGLDNAWQGGTNQWGFSTVGIEALANAEDANLVVIEPIPMGVEETLAHSGLWQRLPAVKRSHVVTLPAVWSFGGLASATRFGELLTQALIADATSSPNGGES